MPGFSVAVVRDGELAGRLRALHRAVLGEEPELRREEALLLAWGLLLPGYAGMVETVFAVATKNTFDKSKGISM